MSVENTTTIAGLVTANPVVQDPVYQGTQHFWLIKDVLKKIFPGAGGTGFNTPITAREVDINSIANISGYVYGTGLTFTTLRVFANWAATQLASLTSLIGVANNNINTINNRLQIIYGVGCIYITTSGVHPGELMGFGTWERWGASRVLLGYDATNPICSYPGQGGGLPDTTLPYHSHAGAALEAGSHQHGYLKTATGSLVGAGAYGLFVAATSAATDWAGSHTHSVEVYPVGVSPVNTNYPPFIVTYMWRRTA
jgi:hypothetical protein